MLCPVCKEVELTPKEAAAKNCLRCVLKRYLKMEIKYDKNVLIQATGRTEEEYEEFKTSATAILAEEPKRPKHNSRVPKDLSPIMVDSKLKELRVMGLTEDVVLKLTLPEAYTIEDRHYEDVEKMMSFFLDQVIHYLAFGPLSGTRIEEYLSQRFKEGGGKGYPRA